MDLLESQYQTLLREYDGVAAEVLRNPSTLSAQLPRIQSLQAQISAVLDKMMQQLAMVKQGTSLDAKRAQLLQQLQRIQRDYNDLRTSTDKLETLRRIRAFEDDSWKSRVRLYVVLFSILALVLLGVLLWKRQTPEITATIPSSPAAMTPLT